MNNREAITLLRNLEDSLDSYCGLNEEGKTAFRMAIEALSCSEFPNNWISCSERLPKKYGEYIITWTTSCVPNKRFVGLAEYDVVNEWDVINGRYNGGWLFGGYMQSYPDVKVIAWMPLPELYQEGE